MSGAAWRPFQALPCAGQGYLAQQLFGSWPWVNVRVCDSRVAARFAPLARPSDYGRDRLVDYQEVLILFPEMNWNLRGAVSLKN